MALVRYSIGLILNAIALMSCSNEKSLQQYLVDKQDDDKFLKIDLAGSLLQNQNSIFSEEEQKVMNSLKKVNVVAFPLKNGDTANYEIEKEKLADIINQEKYKTLVKAGSSGKGATLKYLGEEDAIDEIIIYASDDEKGFALLRVLGEDMRPDQMIQLFGMVEKGNLSGLGGIGEIFKQ